MKVADLCGAAQHESLACLRRARRTGYVDKPNLVVGDSYPAEAHRLGVGAMHAWRVAVWQLTVAAVEGVQECWIDPSVRGRPLGKFIASSLTHAFRVV